MALDTAYDKAEEDKAEDSAALPYRQMVASLSLMAKRLVSLIGEGRINGFSQPLPMKVGNIATPREGVF